MNAARCGVPVEDALEKVLERSFTYPHADALADSDEEARFLQDRFLVQARERIMREQFGRRHGGRDG